jgi:hypothetical protein
MAGALGTRSPEIALAWLPYDAQPRARLAAQLAIQDTPEATRAAVALAHDAIKRDALTPVALRALGMIASRGKTGGANAGLPLMMQAERLSRRDEPTQIWLIEHYARQGQSAEIVRHFDLAMRSSWSAQQTLFPLIAGLLADARVFDALLNRMREKPSWAKPFMNYLVEYGPQPAQTVQLGRRFLDPNNADDLEAIKTLLKNLANRGEYDLAWEFYANTRGRGATIGSASLNDGNFEGTQAYPPFSWTFAEDADLWAGLAPDPTGNGKVLQLSANSGRGGEVARQLVRLNPGHYRLRARVGEVSQDTFERPELRLRCAKEGTEATLVSIKPRTAGRQSQWVEGTFSVSPDCHFQWLAVAITGEGPPDGPTPWVDNIQLMPMGR